MTKTILLHNYLYYTMWPINSILLSAQLSAGCFSCYGYQEGKIPCEPVASAIRVGSIPETLCKQVVGRQKWRAPVRREGEAPPEPLCDVQ